MDTIYTIIIIILSSLILTAIVLIRRKLSRLPIKAPFNSPENFIKNMSNTKSDKKRLIFIGDSITHGLISINYIDLIREELGSDSFEYINAGINSELTWHVLQRIEPIIECNPDFVFILIGTNDCNDSRNLHKAKLAKKYKNLPQLPDEQFFIENYKKLLKILKERTNATVVSLSIPILSEGPSDPAFKRATHFSNIIKRIAGEFNVDYLPLHEKMLEYLKTHPPHPKTKFKYLQTHIIMAIIKHLIFNIPLSKISEKNGLQLLTDHIHLNETGAQMVADLIISYLREKMQAEGNN